MSILTAAQSLPLFAILYQSDMNHTIADASGTLAIEIRGVVLGVVHAAESLHPFAILQ